MFLDKIIDSTQNRINAVRSTFEFAFKNALSTQGMSFICEVKKASPSKGVLSEHFPYLDIAREYEAAGASAISVLTEPEFFKGSERYLLEISNEVSVPTLCKDFIIDEYQIYAAKVTGASAVLLIAEILPEEKLRRFIELAKSLGLSSLVESHSLPELQKALYCGAEIVGVNNRNLDTFEVDIKTSLNLRKYVPDNIIYVAESGIKTPQDVKILAENQVDAVLVGEALMASPDKTEALKRLRSML